MPLVGKFFYIGKFFMFFPINVSNHIEQLMQWLDLMNYKIWRGNQQVFHTIKMGGLILIQQHICMS